MTPPSEPADLPAILAARLDAAAQARLGRSLAIFPAMGADCGGCTLEFAILRSAAHGLARHGIEVVANPASADVLLVAGPLTRTGADPLRRAFAAMGEPRWVVALGDCAVDGGVFAASGAVEGGAGVAVPVDIVVPGCPPTPAAILAALTAIVAANG